MKNPIEKKEDLKGGKLDKIMSYYMLDDSNERKNFLEIVKKEKGKFNTFLDDYQNFFGYKPSKELIELKECLKAYEEHMYSISDIWILEEKILYVSKLLKKKDIHSLINDWSFLVQIFTGLERFGSDPSGDTCFLDTLPNSFGTTEVIIFDHEIGKPADYVAYSISDFVSDTWSESYDDETDEEINKISEDTEKIVNQFNKEAKKNREKRPYYHNPVLLYKRTNWLQGHPTGKPTYAFAKEMAQAPTFDDWLKEKSLLAKEPVLTNYWLLAHFFLGNDNACKEAITLANETPGLVAKNLAVIIEKLLHDPAKAKLGELTNEKITKLKLETRKNCLPELLEPNARETLAVERGEGKLKKLSLKEFKKKIKEGDDPVTIIKKYPDDVATHDLALQEIGKNDKEFEKLIEKYFSKRTDNAYSEWPYGNKEIDARLSLPVSAAFRSGLQFDEDHNKAYTGIAQTLGKFDDDNSIYAYEQAIEKLKPDDKRIEYVIKNLEKSNHPDKNRK
jgi:hypothetical protein